MVISYDAELIMDHCSSGGFVVGGGNTHIRLPSVFVIFQRPQKVQFSFLNLSTAE